MEQGPYEFRSYAIGAKRVRRRTDQSATAFPRFTVLNQFFSRSASARLAVRLLQVFCRQSPCGNAVLEMEWATEKRFKQEMTPP
jgi:hypothetical protein